MTRLHVRLYLWRRKSLGLFDFSPSNSDILFRDYYLSKSGFFLLDLDTPNVHEVRRFGANPATEGLKKVEVNMERRQIIDHNLGKNISDCLWLQIKETGGRVLAPGDLVRLGKQQLYVRSIKTFGSEGKAVPAQSKGLTVGQTEEAVGDMLARISAARGKQEVVVEEQASIDTGAVCRICLEGELPDNPLLNICHCSKHMPTHLECIRSWLHKKTQTTRADNVFYCNLQEIRCELCHHEYPATVRFQNRDISLIKFDVDAERPHILLDILCRNSGANKGFAVIYFEKKDSRYTVGRADANAVTFNDGSVSREHAVLAMTSKGVTLSDRTSKFGTFVKVGRLDFGVSQKSLCVQIDRFLFEFHPFRGGYCGCKFERNAAISKDPFQANTLLERDVVGHTPTVTELDRPVLPAIETPARRNGPPANPNAPTTNKPTPEDMLRELTERLRRLNESQPSAGPNSPGVRRIMPSEPLPLNLLTRTLPGTPLKIFPAENDHPASKTDRTVEGRPGPELARLSTRASVYFGDNQPLQELIRKQSMRQSARPSAPTTPFNSTDTQRTHASHNDLLISRALRTNFLKKKGFNQVFEDRPDQATSAERLTVGPSPLLPRHDASLRRLPTLEPRTSVERQPANLRLTFSSTELRGARRGPEVSGDSLFGECSLFAEASDDGLRFN